MIIKIKLSTIIFGFLLGLFIAACGIYIRPTPMTLGQLLLFVWFVTLEGCVAAFWLDRWADYFVKRKTHVRNRYSN